MDQDIIYIDPRNAVPVPGYASATTRDHRANPGGQAIILRPMPAALPPASTTTTTPPTYPYPYPNTTSPYPYPYPTNSYPTNWPNPANWPPGLLPPGYPFGPMGGVGSWLSSLGGVGTLVDLAAQVVAALLPLPSATDTGDSPVNLEDVLDYQQSLAKAAKVDELIRTGGHVVKTLTRGVR